MLQNCDSYGFRVTGKNDGQAMYSLGQSLHLAEQEGYVRVFVDAGTVKTHIKGIYGKLGVHSRTRAIIRAREIGPL